MRSPAKISCPPGLLFGVVLLFHAPVFGSDESAAESPVSVGAYYYPWYHTDGRHWDAGFAGKSSGLKPALGEYSSRSRSTIRQHIDWSKELGIDQWICSWWGPHSWEDETLRDHVVTELAGESAPKFCIFYESGGLLGLDPEEGIDFDNGASERFARHFEYLAKTYFSHPAYLRVDGKPVVYLYLSRAFAGDYAAAILKARAVVKKEGFDLFLVGDEVFWGEPDPKRIQQFEAITSYNMHGPERFAGLEDWTVFVRESESVYSRFKEVAENQGVGFIPGVITGFDASDAGGNYYPIPRSIFPEFSKMARRYVDRKINSIAITSFNEWHEGTQLEPSKSIPTQ